MDLLSSAPHPNLATLREIALGFPEAVEIETWGDHPTFRAGKKIFAIWGHGHEGNGNRPTVTFKAGDRQALYLEDPRFYYPPYVGSKGWVGMYMDGEPNWPEVAHLLAESYKMVALKRMVAALGRPKG